jgi:DNA-3-methyladenine glycosylase II
VTDLVRADRRALAALTARDRGLARIVARHGPPPLWLRPPGFATLAKMILEQQVSLEAAATLYTRIGRSVPGGWTPRAIARATEPGLRSLGLTRQKARYVAGLADIIARKELRLAAVGRASDADARAMLEALPGIGPWTSNVYLLFALRRPDIWPPGDLALHKAIATMRRLADIPSSDEAAHLALRWKPFRSVAARILWHGYLTERGRS